MRILGEATTTAMNVAENSANRCKMVSYNSIETHPLSRHDEGSPVHTKGARMETEHVTSTLPSSVNHKNLNTPLQLSYKNRKNFRLMLSYNRHNGGGNGAT